LKAAVKRESFQLVRVVLFDPYRNIATLTCSAILLNRNPPASLFTFKPPAGVNVMRR
jgi:outer membrane lipoprotein-sorting protein